MAVTGGDSHTCGLRQDGTAVCWGINHEPSDGAWYGQASPPQGMQFTAISAAVHSHLRLAPGRLAPLLGRGLRDSRAGAHDLRRHHQRDLRCRKRRLGVHVRPSPRRLDGVLGQFTHPIPRAAGRWGRLWPRMAAEMASGSPPSAQGESHTCGLRADGATICWGDNTNARMFPPGDERFVEVSSGGRSHLPVAAATEPSSAGAGSGTYPAPFIKPAPRAARDLCDRGLRFLLCLRASPGWDASLLGRTTRTARPRHPPGRAVYVSISGGSDHACALRPDGLSRVLGQGRLRAGVATRRVNASSPSAAARAIRAPCGRTAAPSAGARLSVTAT